MITTLTLSCPKCRRRKLRKLEVADSATELFSRTCKCGTCWTIKTSLIVRSAATGTSAHRVEFTQYTPQHQEA